MTSHLSRTAFKRMLQRKREEIIRSSADLMKKFMSSESRRTIAEGLEEGDCSVFYQFEHMSRRDFETQRENIREIELALTRLNEGNYGFCEECGHEIRMERLEVIPFALLCTDCQGYKERQLKKRN